MGGGGYGCSWVFLLFEVLTLSSAKAKELRVSIPSRDPALDPQTHEQLHCRGAVTGVRKVPVPRFRDLSIVFYWRSLVSTSSQL